MNNGYDLYDVNNWDLGDKYLSTGSNWKDALIGGISGLGSNSSKQYMYAPTSQWLGNGLASTRVGMYMNPKYRDYASAGRAMSKIAQNNSWGDDSSSNWDVMGNLSRLAFSNVLPQAIGNATRSDNVGLFSDNAGMLSNDYLSAIPSSITDSINGVNTGSDLFSNLGNYTSVDMPYSIW